MTSDDDWFERAFREDETDDATDTESTSDADDTTDGEPTDSDPTADDTTSDETADPFGGVRTDETADPFGGDTTTDETDDPFGGEAATADDRDDPFGGDATTTEATDETDDPFGGAQGTPDVPSGASEQDTTETDPFGGVRPGDDDAAFDESFEAAMGGGGEEFDEEEFESAIDRLDVGIEGLDEMILGGVPVRSLMTVIGSAGTGKTTFGLQFLQRSLADGGKCVYITLEETEESIVSSAEEKGWPFREYVERGDLVVVAMDPIEMANSLDSIRGDLTRLIDSFGADRLVLDSVSLLEMMYDDPAQRRSEVFDFARSLKRAGVTTLLTSEASGDNPFQSRHGLVEYLVDAVFVLRYVRPSDFQETRLAVEIQKIRDANHSRETKPYDITDTGLHVYRQANLF